MNYRAPLYLASQSPMRKTLLEQAQIPFHIAPQTADEMACDWNREPFLVARSIARFKMDHVQLPTDIPSSECFVVTADTICVDRGGKVHGKPKDRADAMRMLDLWREESQVVTAFCLDKKRYIDGSWLTQERIEQSVQATVIFSVPERWLSSYLTLTPSMQCAGAMEIEGYGSLFVKEIHGSYSTILGLPLFEVREALTTLGFFEL